MGRLSRRNWRLIIIILTGASGGIGRELISYLDKIDQVIGIYNSSKPVKEPGSNVTYVQLNIEDSEEVKKFIETWKVKLEKCEKLTVVHLAAAKADDLVVNYSEDDWDLLMQVNLKAGFLLTKHLLPIMIRIGHGRNIFTSSRGALDGYVGAVAYSTSKAGVLGLSKVLSKEYARFNITSNVLLLGAFKTGMFEKLSTKAQQKIINKIPSKKCGDISNIANAINFCMNSDYVSGSVISIDGAMY